jgi:hypothetical protein
MSSIKITNKQGVQQSIQDRIYNGKKFQATDQFSTQQLSLIEKTAVEHGWENILLSTSAEIILTSARHLKQARITPVPHLARGLVRHMIFLYI